MRENGQWVRRAKASTGRRSGPLGSLAAFRQAWLSFWPVRQRMQESVSRSIVHDHTSESCSLPCSFQRFIRCAWKDGVVNVWAYVAYFFRQRPLVSKFILEDVVNDPGEKQWLRLERKLRYLIQGKQTWLLLTYIHCTPEPARALENYRKSLYW